MTTTNGNYNLSNIKTIKMPTLEQDAIELKTWVKKEFVVIKTDFLPLAVAVTQFANKAEGSGVMDAIAIALSPDTNGLSVEINNEAKIIITKALAIELALEAVPDNATPEQLGATSTAVDTAITGLAPKPKSQLFTNLGVIVLNAFKRLTGQEEAPTYAEDAIAVENTYLKLKAALATPAPVGEVNPGRAEELQREALK